MDDDDVCSHSELISVLPPAPCANIRLRVRESAPFYAIKSKNFTLE